MAPFQLTAGTLGYALTFGALGAGFGAALEMGGFGDTRKLAAQFYFRDVTVLKVMFTAIIVAAVLIAGASSFGLLDMSRVWVNPTYLWPGIVGGLVMGVGFIVGGFCPGTSVVGASTLKIDAMLFLLGALVGVWGFGETVGSFEPFFLSSYMGRFTLDQWLHVPMGVAVLLVVAMALFMFWGGELLERRYGKGEAWSAISLLPSSRGKVAAAGALLAAAVVLTIRGDPSPEQRWAWTAPEVKRAVEDRSMFVDPAEVVALRKDINVQTDVLDLRSEHDFNLFHVGGARRVDPADLTRLSDETKVLLDRPANAVTFLVGNGEAAALAAWKSLKALGAPNVYVVDGGVNRWLERYPVPGCVAVRTGAAADGDSLAYRFAHATGDREPAAWPERGESQLFLTPCEDEVSRGGEGGHGEITWPAYAFTKKVKLKAKAAVKGGCG
ncbi:MAG TPA: YeeE/YedE thiosulfate transporter family protein [Anaeromyxobacter sp.]